MADIAPLTSDMATAVETSSKPDATLPEPAEHSAQANAAVSADDLIAQLADTEIEKMIAATEDLKQTVDEAIAPAEAEPAEASVLAAPAVETEHVVEAEVASPEAAEQVPEAEATVETAVMPEIAIPDETSELQSAAADVARELEADAAQHLSHAVTPAGSHNPKASSKSVVASGALAVARVVNRPVCGMSDSTRELIGSIAIVTLVNAMAILLYVMLFR